MPFDGWLGANSDGGITSTVFTKDSGQKSMRSTDRWNQRLQARSIKSLGSISRGPRIGKKGNCPPACFLWPQTSFSSRSVCLWTSFISKQWILAFDLEDVDAKALVQFFNEWSILNRWENNFRLSTSRCVRHTLYYTIFPFLGQVAWCYYSCASEHRHVQNYICVPSITYKSTSIHHHHKLQPRLPCNKMPTSCLCPHAQLM